MMQNYLIGLDLGGGGVRCLIVDAGSGQSAAEFKPWMPGAITRFETWGYSFDPGKVWAQVGEVTRAAMAKMNAQPEAIKGIAVTSMRLSMVVIDQQGDALLALPNTDARALNQGMQIAAELGDEIYRRTGRWPSPTMMAARLMWIMENSPGMLQEAQAVLSLSDWVSYQLTNVITAERSQAAESGLYNYQTQTWAQDLIARFGIPVHIFPVLVQSGNQIGTLTAGGAQHLGLQPGTPVAAGGGDTQCGLLGLGAVRHGDLGIVAGTTCPVQQVTAELCIDPEKRLWAGAHIIPGLYVLESNAGSMGTALEWFAKTIFPEHPHAISALGMKASQAALGAGGMISTIGAELFNATAMGFPVGHLTASTMGNISGSGDQANIARAFLEGLAFSARANIDQVLDAAGTDLDKLRVGGGMARSKAWTDILAQVCTRPVSASANENVSALGAAICAGVGAGFFEDHLAGAAALVKESRTVLPDEDKAGVYRELYADWLDLLHKRRESDMHAADILLERMAERTPGKEITSIPFRPKIYLDADMGAEALAAMRQIGDVTYESYREGNVLIGEEMVDTLQGYHVFVTEVDIVEAEVLQALPDLRMIVVCRGNPTNIDLDACSAAGIPVVNTPGRNANAVADLTVTLILMLARKLQAASAFLRQPGNEAGDMGRMGMAHFNFCGSELWKKTVGIIGCGAIGQRVIRRLRAFEANILVYDPFLSLEQVNAMGADQVELEELLAQSDFISLHAPVNDATRNMLNAEAFASMKAGASLVNTARAALVDQTALLDALQSGRLAGAALDVFPVEPPGSDDPLLAFENVIATPHIAGNTVEVGIHQGLMAADEITRLLGGQTPQHLMNPSVMDTFTWTGERIVKEAVLSQLAESSGPGVTDLAVEQQRKAEQEKTSASLEPTGDDTAKGKGFFKRLLSKKSTSAQGDSTLLPAASPQPGTAPGQREKFLLLLRRFAALLMADAELKEKSQKTDMMMRFVIKDIEQVFYMSLKHGEVVSGLGEPGAEADLTLKMDADIFDGLFTGRVNGNKAVMTGKMSFAGDTRKAMSMRRYFNIMNTSYQQALEAVGGVGDLTQISAAPESASAAQAPSRQPIVSGQPNVQVSSQPVRVGDNRDEILQVMSDFFSKGLITATGGNISARSDQNENEIWISPSSLYKGDLRADMMVRIDLDGKLIGDNDFSASSERQMHCAIYRSRPEIQAVIHSHAPQATLMAMTGTQFLPVSTEIAFIGEIPVVPFIMPGTPQLGEAVSRAMGRHGTAVLMQNHGLVVAGTSLRRAADMTEIIESTAEKLIACRMMGVKPPVLPDDILEELEEVGRMMA